jgi:hypothetical protein
MDTSDFIMEAGLYLLPLPLGTYLQLQVPLNGHG